MIPWTQGRISKESCCRKLTDWDRIMKTGFEKLLFPQPFSLFESR